MTLRRDRSCTETKVLRTTLGATPETHETVENGTFSVEGTQTTFSIASSHGRPGFSYTGAEIIFSILTSHGRPGFSYTGAISGDVLSYTFQGMSYRYQR